MKVIAEVRRYCDVLGGSVGFSLLASARTPAQLARVEAPRDDLSINSCRKLCHAIKVARIKNFNWLVSFLPETGSHLCCFGYFSGCNAEARQVVAGCDGCFRNAADIA